MRYHHPPRPYTPHVHLRARIKRLEQELLQCWQAYEGIEPYSEQGRWLTGQIHQYHLAITDTLVAIELRKHKIRGSG